MRRTPLYELHRQLGARFTDYAGYRLPLHYGDGVISEHLHTREQAGLFEVSHMGQLQLEGSELATALETLLPADLQALAPGRLVYSLLTNDSGGVRDDLILNCLERERFLLVVNAACAEQDATHLREQLATDIDVRLLEERAMFALQGPQAVQVMEQLAPAAIRLPFMGACQAQIAGIECQLMRCGYTGEDGFEITLPAAAAEDCARQLLQFKEVRPIGLGARDSLRLEAGLCLYGRDLDENITPVEAGLGWAVSKTRRRDGERAGGFPGARVILEQLEHGAQRQRIGLRVSGRAPLRDGAQVLDREQKPVGVVSSGGFSPSLEAPVAMAYLQSPTLAAQGPLHAVVRGAVRELQTCPLPFVPHRRPRP